MAKNTVKNGKTSIQKRPSLDQLDIFGEASLFDVDPRLEEYMKEKQKTLRWINAAKFKQSGGFNSKGWNPVRVGDIPEAILTAASSGFGTADGFIMRNDMMLAYKSDEAASKHRNQLKVRADLASNRTKEYAANIKQGLSEYGSVIEGYEENEE